MKFVFLCVINPRRRNTATCGGGNSLCDCQTHQIKVVTAFLMPVIPLRELLEENSAGLAGCKALCDLLPFHVLCGLRHGVGATFLGGQVRPSSL